MALTSKQRSQLKGIAAGEDTIVQIGKNGLTENVITSINDALECRELVKCKVLESSPLTPAEACEEAAAACKAEPVQVIGTKFVLYRRSKKHLIILVK